MVARAALGSPHPTGCATRYKLVRFTLSGEELLREAANGLQIGPIDKTQQQLLYACFFIGNSPLITNTSHNGLWEMNLDGSNLTHLIKTSTIQYSFVNYRSQEPWSNISRHMSIYVLQVNEFQNIIETHSLLVGSVLGGEPKVFATIADGSQLGVVGWTIMSLPLMACQRRGSP